MKQLTKKNKISAMIQCVILLVLVAVPFVKTGYIIRFLTTLFMYASLSQIWNILGGFAGYISLGLAGFIGIGAYSTGILMNLGVNFYVSLLIAGIGSALFSLFVGLPILRLKAGYYTISTFAVAFILRELSNNLTDVTGGGKGLNYPLMGMGINQLNSYFYLHMLFALICISILCRVISKASLGYGLMAIKEDEDAANVLGINTTMFKVIAFVITGFLGAVIGGIYGNWLTYIDPGTVFDQNLSVMVIIMAMVGGAGTVAGPIIGAILIQLVSEFLWNNFLSVHQLFLGVILILTVIFIPKGIMDIVLYQKDGLSFEKLKEILKENISKYRV